MAKSPDHLLLFLPLCSYAFGFKGPAISVDTACSSSLVASHIAAGNVLSGVSSGGLAAGAGLLLSPDTTCAFQPPVLLAPLANDLAL